MAELALQMEQAYADALAAGAADARSPGPRQSAVFGLARARPGDRERGGAARALVDRRGPRLPLRRALLPAQPDVRGDRRWRRSRSAIGANTAIFTIVDTLVLRGLPYRDPGRLMAIETRKRATAGNRAVHLAAGILTICAQDPRFRIADGHRPGLEPGVDGARRGGANSRACMSRRPSSRCSGCSRMLGRAFTPEEDELRRRRKDVALLSYGFWQRRFGGGPDAIGQKLALDGSVYEVIGVMPRGFRYEGEPIAGTATDIDIYARWPSIR